MINIEQTLIDAKANVRVIGTVQKFLRLGRDQAPPDIERFVSGISKGEIHFYDHGQIEIDVREGVITLGIYSEELGLDYYQVISK